PTALAAAVPGHRDAPRHCFYAKQTGWNRTDEARCSGCCGWATFRRVLKRCMLAGYHMSRNAPAFESHAAAAWHNVATSAERNFPKAPMYGQPSDRDIVLMLLT